MTDAMYIILHTGYLYFDTHKKEAAQEDSSVLHCIPSSTILSIFFSLSMQLLFFLLVPFQDFLHSLLCSRPILHTGQFDQQITHDHSIMGTANDKSYDTTHDNLEDDTHQYIHQVSHQDSTPSAVILHLIPHFQLVQKRILRKRVKHIILDRTA